jgi:hypothetical protein
MTTDGGCGAVWRGVRKTLSVDVQAVTFRQLQWFFTRYSMKQTADALGCGVTLLKRLSRSFGVKYWPLRKVRSTFRPTTHTLLPFVTNQTARLSP